MISQQYPGSNLETYTHPERLTAIVDRLMLEPVKGVRWMLPTAVTTDQLTPVHDTDYVAHIESLKGASCWLSKDTTAVSPGSVEAAGLAAGAMLDKIPVAIKEFQRKEALAPRAKQIAITSKNNTTDSAMTSPNVAHDLHTLGVATHIHGDV
ncbi:hypothetical protein QVZ43_03385 [Marinobacter sp. chi1]|uniref:Histone deacetylase domain-containing protein n=1 Tax=Marinobacter suaedae TaxID=3057675 RepID=A0ABT8VXM5_9GAMM|nr:hypothetical protein [Marinobacter sp. chi1]MDO3720751.1 hypothetical protein [Marinobacter sp. chi1]